MLAPKFAVWPRVLLLGVVIGTLATTPRPATAEAPNSPDRLRLVINGHVVPDAAPLARAPIVGELLLLRDSTGTMTAARDRVAADSGFAIHAFLPPDSYLVSVRPGTAEDGARTAEDAVVRAAGFVARSAGRYRLQPFDNAWKIDHAFADAIAAAAADDDADSLTTSTDGGGTAAATPPSQRDIPVVVHGVGSLDELEELFRDLDLGASSRPTTPGKARLGLQVPASDLASLLPRLAARPGVLAVEPGGLATLLNSNAGKIVQFGAPRGTVTTLPIWEQGLTGAGVVIAILDTGLDVNHIYFGEADESFPPLNEGSSVGTPDTSRRKVIAYDFLYAPDYPALPGSDFDNQSHGTFVAGNAAGSRLDFPLSTSLNNGIAPGAHIVVQDGGFAGLDNCSDLAGLGCPVIDLTPILEQAYQQGARIHNNSWGDRENFMPQNTYTAACIDVDDMMWRFPQFLIVCAAGNGGPGSATVGSPSVAKNAISAAATGSPTANSIPGGANDFDALTSFSSRGPSASTGQIKPDLAAPGVTRSASTDGDASTADSSVAFVQGTSMASPVTAGAAALVMDYLQEGFYPSGQASPDDAIAAPSAALVKAILIAGAADMGGVAGAAPNFGEGWGRLDLNRSLVFAGDDEMMLLYDSLDAFAATGSAAYERIITLEPSDTVRRTRIVVAWSDPPASELASSFMVNDLDLTVTDLTTNAVYHGNEFDATTGLSIANGAPSDTNNVEAVTLEGPAVGIAARRLKIEVTAPRIITGPQGFALAIYGTPADPPTIDASGVVAR
jgi:subtilisin family serine protease